MKTFKIIVHICILYGLYLVGLWIQTLLDLFLPGSIIGMILLFFLLTFNIIKSSWIDKGVQFIIRDMPLLFIPATVGVINYLELFLGKGFVLVIIVVISTILVMISSGLTAQSILHRKASSND